MNTIEIKPNMSVGVPEILSSLSRMNNAELEDFFKQVRILVDERKTATASETESKLLRKIRQALLPTSLRTRYNQLQNKLYDDEISEPERLDFLELNRQLEIKGAERLEAMLELAKLRRVTFDELLEQLNMKTPFPENA